MARTAGFEGSGGMMDLRAQHADLDRRVRELDRRAYLTPSEQSERAELKKLKLALKDRFNGGPPAEAG